MVRAERSARTLIAGRAASIRDGLSVASFRRATCLIALALAACCAVFPARADTYPTRAVTIIVSLAPGTGMDTLVRLYAEKLAPRLGQPVVIDNRPGGAGVVASAIMAIRPTLFKKFPFDPLVDFVPISLYVKSPFVLVCDPALPARSFTELVGYAKARSGQLAYSSTGIGGAPHLSVELLKQRFGFEATHVPYRNSPQSIADVAAGHVQMAIVEAGASLPLIRDGKLRALAVTSTTRFPTLPDVPTLAEALGLPDFEMVSWHVILAKAGTSQGIVDRLHGELGAILAADEMRQKISAIGLIPYPSPPIEGIRAYIRAEREKWATVVRKLGLEGSQ